MCPVSSTVLVSAEQSLIAFLERRKLTRTPMVEYEICAIDASWRSFLAANKAFESLSDSDLAARPAAGPLLNLLHRAWEHVEASLVAFVTDSGASAEVVARTALELSASILYILASDPHRRLIAFFRDYLRETADQARKWEQAASGLPERERKNHLSGIARRRAGIDALSSLVDRISQEMHHASPTAPDETWPKVALRFVEIGEASTHRTAYARMCSQAHGDAEETLRYIIGVTQDSKLFDTMALETAIFSRFMVYFAVMFFLKATIRCVEWLGHKRAAEEVARKLVAIEGELNDIAASLP